MVLIATTTKNEFDEHVLKNDKLVLVDFWADWCPPCHAMAPILEKISEHMKDTLDVVKVNVEASVDNNMLANEQGVQGIPNMQVFKDGKQVDELVGLRPLSVLEDELKAHL